LGVGRWQARALTVQPLRPAESLARYVASPTGTYFAGRGAAVFCASEDLCGVLFWGDPDEADAELVTAAISTSAGAVEHRYGLLVDLRRLELIDLRVFDSLGSTLASRFISAGGSVTQVALITPNGSVGAAIAQFFELPMKGVFLRTFVDAKDALVWIGATDPTLLASLERIPHTSSIADSMLAGLRALVWERPASSTNEAARRLGTSRRTLQRRLRECGTSFQQEVDAARLGIAKRLMLKTDNPLKWIAVESGYTSLQHFSSSFRARVGLSPSAWRARTSGTRHAR
jgi:AraC-like DNA-binding protein